LAAPLGIVWQLNTKTWPRETVTGRFLGCDPEKQQTACSAQFWILMIFDVMPTQILDGVEFPIQALISPVTFFPKRRGGG
jgi:hypothetical protein